MIGAAGELGRLMNASVVGFTLLAVLAGTLFPVQTAINARLAAGVGGPVLATLISFLAGGVALAAIVLLAPGISFDWSRLKQLPPWLFVAGGMLGATYLGLNVFLVPRIGAGAMLALVVAGQMAAALLIDQFGLFGVVPHALSPARVVGATAVVIGAFVVRFL